MVLFTFLHTKTEKTNNKSPTNFYENIESSFNYIVIMLKNVILYYVSYHHSKAVSFCIHVSLKIIYLISIFYYYLVKL